MLKIKVDSKKGIERALKDYKSKTIRTRLHSALKELKEYEKPSAKKRKEKKKAKYVSKKYGKH